MSRPNPPKAESIVSHFNPRALAFRPKQNLSSASAIQHTSGLHALPAELYIKIISFLDAARDVASLSRACRRFLDLAASGGWRVFCICRFPTIIQNRIIPDGRYWMKLAERLTSFSHGIDRRHVLAKPIGAEKTGVVRISKSILHARDDHDGSNVSVCEVFDYRSGSDRYTRPAQNGHQTMNFQPQIASRAIIRADHQRLALSWSTGPELNFCLHDVLPKTGTPLSTLSTEYKFNTPCFEGAAFDITSISMFAPEQVNQIDLIVGRASSHLHRMRISISHRTEDLDCSVQNTYRRSWDGLAVRASDTSNTLVAAVGEGRGITLWDASSCEADVEPLSDIELDDTIPFASTWDIKFTSPQRIVVGLGQSTKPLALCKVSTPGLIQTARLGIDEDASHLVDTIPKKRSVYAIQSLPPLSRVAGSNQGDTFLTGWFDGFVRLYDTRASEVPVTTYHDPIDSDSAVYSLASYGLETFLAGTANSLLKFFDFRMGNKVYNYTDAQPCTEKEPFPPATTKWKQKDASVCTYHSITHQQAFVPNANIFIYGHGPQSRQRSWSRNPRVIAPIYSLSVPSPELPFVYAGTQGMVYELEASYGKVSKNHHIPLSMYETNEGTGETISAMETRLMPQLRTQDFNTNPKIKRQGMNRTRLGEMWLRDYEIMSLW